MRKSVINTLIIFGINILTILFLLYRTKMINNDKAPIFFIAYYIILILANILSCIVLKKLSKFLIIGLALVELIILVVFWGYVFELK